MKSKNSFIRIILSVLMVSVPLCGIVFAQGQDEVNKKPFWSLNGNDNTDATQNFIGTTNAQDFQIKTNGITRMIVKQDGKIGFGILGPTTNLHIVTPSSIASIKLQGAQKLGEFGVNGNGPFIFSQTPGGSMSWFTKDGFGNFGRRMFLSASGNLCIGGGTVPTEKLFVEGNILATSLADPTIPGPNVSTLLIADQNGVLKKGALVALDNDNLPPTNAVCIGALKAWIGGNLPRSIILCPELNKVGIGETLIDSSTLSTTSKVPNQANAMVHIAVTNPVAASDVHRPLTFSKISSDGAFRLDWSFEMRAGDEPTLQLFRAKRPIGGGATEFGTPLEITWDGIVGAREIIVQTDPLPDYVFEEEYDLMPLEEVEAFIDTAMHLKGIPSAKEVEENGNRLKLGDMTTRLLVKVEEITLYMIELNKENERLKSRITELENKTNN